MKSFSILSLGALAAGLLLSTAAATAQGAGGPRGNFDPAEMRDRMAQRMQEVLKASDEEFKAIRPLLEDVQEKQRASMTGRFGGMGMMAGGRGAPGGRPGGPQADDNQRQRRQGAGERPAVPGAQEVEALSQALESDSTPASEIRAKLQAVREVRIKSETELKQSRERLRAVLTGRQEAQMVLMGLLD
jgi:Spy/CpxP family protein refolding chaperone